MKTVILLYFFEGGNRKTKFPYRLKGVKCYLSFVLKDQVKKVSPFGGLLISSLTKAEEGTS